MTTTQLLRYEGYDFAHPTLAAPLRPIIAHEVNLEAMRQAEVSTRDHAGAGSMHQILLLATAKNIQSILVYVKPIRVPGS